MNSEKIKFLTLEDDPSFKNCTCIVCRENPVKIILDMGCHQTQLCMDCFNELKRKIQES